MKNKKNLNYFSNLYLNVGGSSCSSFKTITPLRFLSELKPESSSDEFCLLGKSQSTAACHTWAELSPLDVSANSLVGWKRMELIEPEWPIK